MSSQSRPTTEHVDVCDLCGKPVDTYSHRDWSALNVGHAPMSGPNKPERKAFVFWRKGWGDRSSGAPDHDNRSWKWDFHGECLVAALTPLVTDEARRVAQIKKGDEQ